MISKFVLILIESIYLKMKIAAYILTVSLFLSVVYSLKTHERHFKFQENHYQATNFADTIFFNGQIITMAEKNQTASAVAIKNDTIIGVGNIKDLLKFKGNNTKMVNLKGNTMTPGFYDGHSHFSLSAVLANQGFNLFSEPFGNVTKIADIINNVKTYIKEKNIPKGEKVYGSGYDDSKLQERRYLTKEDLDQISTDHYILLLHYSGHVGTANSLILKALKTTNQTKIAGGIIVLGADGQPNGVLKENALINYAHDYFGKVTKEKAINTQQLYFQVGYTTAQDVTLEGTQILEYAAAGKDLKIDIYSYQLLLGADSSNPFGYYNTVKAIAQAHKTPRFTFRGAKTFFDGSLQGETAALSQPYLSWPPTLGSPPKPPKPTQINPVLQSTNCTQKWCGPLLYNQSIVNALFKEFLNKDIDCIIHCNGDAAIGEFIEGVRSARNATNLNQQTRLILNHGQTITDKQLDAVKALNIALSFFIPQIYYFGDDYRNVYLGAERAERLNPTKSALGKKIRFSLHTDAPVFPINFFGPLHIISTAVNRLTVNGNPIGPQQSITVYEALKAVTIDAAWQGREDKTKGSIQVGKKADLVVLSKNPLKVQDAGSIRDIFVVSTYKNGQLVYSEQQTTKQTIINNALFDFSFNVRVRGTKPKNSVEIVPKS